MNHVLPPTLACIAQPWCENQGTCPPGPVLVQFLLATVQQHNTFFISSLVLYQRLEKNSPHPHQKVCSRRRCCCCCCYFVRVCVCVAAGGWHGYHSIPLHRGMLESVEEQTSIAHQCPNEPLLVLVVTACWWWRS